MSIVQKGENWGQAQPGSIVGTLVLRGVAAPKTSEALNTKKRELEEWLRANYSSREELQALPVLQAYADYYKAFRKNYHVLFQLESVALKGKPIPSVNPIVEAMFISELENMLLTAGHDLDRVQMPVTADIASGQESYTLMSSQQQTAQAGDMMMADQAGVISSVIYGPDRRTRITPQTKNTFFVVYAPPGIGERAVKEHLGAIRDYIGLFSTDFEPGPLECTVAKPGY